MDQSIFLKWLGVAGIELKVNEHVLIIDPYFTRIPFVQRKNYVVITKGT
ncbi:MAG: hypothetical protein ACYDIA_23950 [Candidatus Humimicrobiaceae bacterium]